MRATHRVASLEPLLIASSTLLPKGDRRVEALELYCLHSSFASPPPCCMLPPTQEIKTVVLKKNPQVRAIDAVLINPL